MPKDKFPKLGDSGVALIVVDMESSYLDQIEEGPRGEVIEANRRCLVHCNPRPVPIVFVGPWSGVNPISDLTEVVGKDRYCKVRKFGVGGFFGTKLEKTLNDLGVNRVVYGGVFAGACPLRTAEEGIRRGIEGATASNLIASQRGPSAESSAIKWWRDNCYFAKDFSAFF